MLPLVRVQTEVSRPDGFQANGLHLWYDLLKETIFVTLPQQLLEVKLKLLVTDLITFLILPILLRILLYGFVREMHQQATISLQGV